MHLYKRAYIYIYRIRPGFARTGREVCMAYIQGGIAVIEAVGGEKSRLIIIDFTRDSKTAQIQLLIFIGYRSVRAFIL